MSDFPSPPRGSGRHSQPRGRQRDQMVESNPNLFRVPVPGDPDYGGRTEMVRPRMSQPPPRDVLQDSQADLVVPRVFLEPDEMMDRLRARAFRFAIVRDVVLIVLGTALIVQWGVVPLLSALGF